MFKLLLKLLKDELGGLGIAFASTISACAENTGDDSLDAITKIKRLINRKGKQFVLIANWPFLRSDISFSVTTTTSVYSGASYLPTTFKKVVAAKIRDNTDDYPLEEDSISEKYNWANPDDNQDRPNKFCITRVESGYWEVVFNKLPDKAYTVYMDIELQWSELSADSNEAVITKPYEASFEHYCSMARFMQQGDTENYQLYKDAWDGGNPASPARHSILGQILASLSSPLKKKQIVMSESYVLPFKNQLNEGDYQRSIDA